MSDAMSDMMKPEQSELMISYTSRELKNNKYFLFLINEYKKYEDLKTRQIQCIKDKDFLQAHELENSIKNYDISTMKNEILELRRTSYGKNNYYDYVWDRISESSLFYFSKKIAENNE